MKILLTLLTLLLAPVSVWAQIQHHCTVHGVGRAGSITVNTSQELEDACQNPPSGNLILVDPTVTYGGDITCDNQGSASNPITIRSTNGNQWRYLGVEDTSGRMTITGSYYRILNVDLDKSMIEVKGNDNRISRARCLNATRGGNSSHLYGCIHVDGARNRVDHIDIGTNGTNYIRRAIRVHPDSGTRDNLFDHIFGENLNGGTGNSGESIQDGRNNDDLNFTPNTEFRYIYIRDFSNEAEVASIKTNGSHWYACRFEDITEGRFSFRFGSNSVVEKCVFRNFAEPRGVAVLGDNQVVKESLFDNANISVEKGTSTMTDMLTGADVGCHPAARNPIIASNTGMNGADLRWGITKATGGSCTGDADGVNFQQFDNVGFDVRTNTANFDTLTTLPSHNSTRGSHIEVQRGDVGYDSDLNDCLCSDPTTCPGGGGAPPPPPTVPSAVVARRVEPVHNNTTNPNSITITDHSTCQATIEANNNAFPVRTVLIAEGICNVETLRLDNIKVFPLNQGKVSIKCSSGTCIEIGDNVELAGVLCDATEANTCIDINPANFGRTQLQGNIIRNNDIRGGVGGTLVEVDDLVLDTLFVGNRINGGGGTNSTGGHAMKVEGCAEVTIEDNIFIKDNSSNELGASWNWGSQTGSLLKVRLTDDVVIKDNAFLKQVPGGNPALSFGPDTTVVESTQSVINNYFHGPDLAMAGPCMESGGATPVDDLVVRGNVLNRCGSAGGSAGALQMGSSHADNDVTVTIDRNVIINDNDTVEAVAFEDATITMTDNTVINGRMEFTGNNTLELVENNLFNSVHWTGDDFGSLAVTSCTHNNDSSPNNGIPIPAACTNTTTTTPAFADCAYPTFHCEPSGTFLTELGNDGFVRGAVKPPIIDVSTGNEPEIGDTGGVMVVNMTPSEAGLDVAGFDRTKVTIDYDTVSNAFDAPIVKETDPIRFLIRMNQAPANNGVAVTFSGTSRWCKDTYDFGHIDSSIEGTINDGNSLGAFHSGCFPYTDLAVTNNTAGTVNNDPVALDDPNETTTQGVAISIDVMANDSDGDGDTINIESFDTVTTQSQTVALDDNGTPLDPDDDELQYFPNPTFVGVDTFTYTINDGNGGVSLPATVTINVTSTTANSGKFYVNPATGNDANTDSQIQSKSTPAATMQRAIDAACGDGTGAGDEVEFATGTYTLPAFVSCTGDATADFKLYGEVGATPIINLSGVTLGTGNAGFELAPSSEFITVRNLVILNVSGAINSCLKIGSGASNNLTLDDIFIANCGQYGVDINNGGLNIRLEGINMTNCAGGACLQARGVTALDMKKVSVKRSLAQATVGDYAGIRLQGVTTAVIEESELDEVCNGIVIEDNSGVASSGIIVRDSTFQRLGGTQCSTAVGMWARANTDDVTFIGNRCKAGECTRVTEQATNIRHIHGTYVGRSFYQIAGCEGASETSPGTGFRIHNTILSNASAAIWEQWNGTGVPWSDDFPGNNNLFDGTIDFDVDGRVGGVECAGVIAPTSYDAADAAQFDTDTSILRSSQWGSPNFEDEDQFLLTPGILSPAINGGECLMTLATSVTEDLTLTFNGVSPLELFINHTQYRERTLGDRVYFDTTAMLPTPVPDEGDDEEDTVSSQTSAVIASMTSNTITFTSEVAANAGDCFGPRRLEGLPDIGAIERPPVGIPSSVISGGVWNGGVRQ